MHFHQKILNHLLDYRNNVDRSFNFIVRQRHSKKDKNFIGGKFAHGLVFQGTNDYCFVGLVDKSGGVNATKSVGLIFKPTSDGFVVNFDIVFPGENDIELVEFYKTLASKFGDINWDPKGTKAYKVIGEFEEDNPKILFDWLKNNYPVLQKVAEESDIPNLIPSDQKFNDLQENMKLKLKEASNTENIISNSKKKYWLLSPGRNAIMWDKFYEEGYMALGWDELGNLSQYSDKDAIREALRGAYGGESNKMNDVTANWEFANEMRLGDVVIVKKGRSCLLGYGIITSEYYHESRYKYHNRRKVNWLKKGSWNLEHKMVLKTLTDISTYTSEDENYNYYYEWLMSRMDDMKIVKGISDSTRNKTLINQILYGPPGTGKTYKLQNEYFSKYTISEESLTNDQVLDNIAENLSWWQTFAIALRDIGESSSKEILAHPIVKAKERLSSAKSIHPILWSRLQAHTLSTCPNVNVKDRSEPQVFFKTDDSRWSLDSNAIDNLYPDVDDLLEKVRNPSVTLNDPVKNYEFVTFHQSFSYEDFVEGIKPIMENGETDLGYEIEDGVFKKMCQRAKADPDHNYAIFIDEINRGNVSAIFGELITLIEKDKRGGAKNALEVQLPYSKNKFSVPANLHIYGTMNTADRSVEALDTALRRRFTFKELMPNASLLSNKQFNGFTLEEVLRTINDRIEILVDRDHTIGHSYFLSVASGDIVALQLVFQDNIIPLLQEYFYHDYEKIALILGAGFVMENRNSQVKFADFKNLEIPSIETQYVLKNNIDDIEEAILSLLNRQTKED